jgi:branched-chain amino acid transport system ATP-binding protein
VTAVTTVDHAARDRAAPTGSRAAALRLTDLSWQVGGRHIVDRVSLEVPPGQFTAVIGPNGAGKTSLFNLISGLSRPIGGRIALGERDITALPPHRRARLGLGRTFQTSSVFAGMSVAQNVELAAQATLSGTAGALRLWRRVGQEARDTAARALDLARLAGRAAATASTLSHGEKRKLELAILLACRPRVILLDEPMAGMAAEEVPELTEVIRDAHRGGATILMVEHHMDVVMGLAERIAVLHHGALLACGAPAEISADPAVRDAYMGEPL